MDRLARHASVVIPPRIRPGFVILLGVVVAPLSLLFGYAMLFEDGFRIGVYGRLVSAFAIYGLPVLVSILLRREAPTTRLAAAFLVSGGMLIFVLPLAVSVPEVPFLVIVGVLATAVLVVTLAFEQVDPSS